MQVVFEESSRVANDAVRGIRTVVSFSSEQKVMEMYEMQCEAPKLQGVWNGIVGGVSLGFANFVLFTIYAFSFYIGAVLTNHGYAEFSQVFKVTLLLTVLSLFMIQCNGYSYETAFAGFLCITSIISWNCTKWDSACRF